MTTNPYTALTQMKYQRGPIPLHAFDPADLTAGDSSAAEFDWSMLQAERVADVDDPAFEEGYHFLHDEFHSRAEMESREVIAQRLKWDPSKSENGLALLYEMLVITSQEEVAAVRDHTAIVAVQSPHAPAVVHLSHVLVEKSWRGTGLGAWLRTLPIDTARGCMKAAGRSEFGPIVLVGEMEHPSDVSQVARLRAYERAGFLKIDPARVPYHQPDFRSPSEIDSTGLKPLPMALVVRRVGLEEEKEISGGEVREIVSSLYRMFEMGFRKQDMAGLWREVNERYPGMDEMIALVPPTRS